MPKGEVEFWGVATARFTSYNDRWRLDKDQSFVIQKDTEIYALNVAQAR